MTRIQEKRNHNNKNFQWIASETKENDGKNINIVNIRGTNTRSDETK